MRRVEGEVSREWHRADEAGEPALPHEFLYRRDPQRRAGVVLPDRPGRQLARGGL